MKLLFVVVGVTLSLSHLNAFAEPEGGLAEVCEKYCPKEAKSKNDEKIHKCVEKQYRLNKSIRKELEAPGNKCWEKNEEYEKRAEAAKGEEKK